MPSTHMRRLAVTIATTALVIGGVVSLRTEAATQPAVQGEPRLVAMPTAVQEVSARAGDMSSGDVFGALHQAAVQTMSEIPLDDAINNPETTELLLVPHRALSEAELLRLLEEFGDRLVFRVVHAALPGDRQTQTTEFPVLTGMPYEESVKRYKDWMNEVLAEDLVAASEDETGDLEADLAQARAEYHADITRYLTMLSTGTYHVYGLRAGPAQNATTEDLSQTLDQLRGVEIGAIFVARDSTPAAFVPPTDPARDRAIAERVQ